MEEPVEMREERVKISLSLGLRAQGEPLRVQVPGGRRQQRESR